MSQTTIQAGLQLIESFEGLRLNSYQDSVDVWSIGYGHTGFGNSRICIKYTRPD